MPRSCALITRMLNICAQSNATMNEDLLWVLTGALVSVGLS